MKLIFLIIVILFFDQHDVTVSANQTNGSGKNNLNDVEKTISTYINKHLSNTYPRNNALIKRHAQEIFKDALGTWKTLHNYQRASHEQRKNDDSKYIDSSDVDFAVQSDLFKKIYAISVANKLPFLVSTAKRSYQKQVEGELAINPGSNAEAVLQLGSGSCGNQTAVALALFEAVGIKARPLQFYYTLNNKRYSHAVPEVFIADKWRIIDTTYGAYWLCKKSEEMFSIAPTEDVLAGNKVELFWNSAQLPYVLWPLFNHPDPFSYVNSKGTILRDGKGEIVMNLNKEHGSEDFKHMPNYIGDNKADGVSEGITYLLQAPEKKKVRITLFVDGAAFSGEGKVFIRAGNQRHEIRKDRDKYEFNVDTPNRLSIESALDVAYIVLSKFEWTFVNN